MIPIVPLVGGDRREPSLEDATPQGGLYQHLLLRQCMALPPTKGGTRGPPLSGGEQALFKPWNY